MLVSTKSIRQAEECLVSTGSAPLVVYIQQVNCDMELECGGHKGGWTTIVKLDTSKGDPCSSGWTKITTPGDSPKVVCRSGNDAGGCYSAIFTTYNITSNKICGQVKGYMKGTPNGFYSTKYDTK